MKAIIDTAREIQAAAKVKVTPTFDLQPLTTADLTDPQQHHHIQPLIDLLLAHYPGARRMPMRTLKRLVMRTATEYRKCNPKTGSAARQLPLKVRQSAHRAGHIILG